MTSRTRLVCALLALSVSLPAQQPRPTQRRVSLQWPAYQMANYVDPATFPVDSLAPCRPRNAVITPDSVGPLRVGQSVREAVALCSSVRAAWVPTSEDMAAPALLVRMGRVVVQVLLADTTSRSLILGFGVTDSLARTAEGIRPGDSLATILKVYGSNGGASSSECQLWATFDKAPGLTFRLDYPNTHGCPETTGSSDQNNLARLPTTTLIREIGTRPPNEEL